MDVNLKLKTTESSFGAVQRRISDRSEQHEVAIYLRDGSIWVGHFIDDHGELDFGDDRHDAAHGLSELLDSHTFALGHGDGRPGRDEWLSPRPGSSALPNS